MFLAVRGFLARSNDSAADAHGILDLLSACVLGAAVYAAAMVVLWMLAGRPAGTESYALARIKPTLARLRARWG
jgi:hypothetical protein